MGAFIKYRLNKGSNYDGYLGEERHLAHLPLLHYIPIPLLHYIISPCCLRCASARHVFEDKEAQLNLEVERKKKRDEDVKRAASSGALGALGMKVGQGPARFEDGAGGHASRPDAWNQVQNLH